MKVDVRAGPDLKVGRPEVLFESLLSLYYLARGYGVHPDGRRFLFVRAKEELERGGPSFGRIAKITRLNLVHSWFRELERLAPRRN